MCAPRIQSGSVARKTIDSVTGPTSKLPSPTCAKSSSVSAKETKRARMSAPASILRTSQPRPCFRRTRSTSSCRVAVRPRSGDRAPCSELIPPYAAHRSRRFGRGGRRASLSSMFPPLEKRTSQCACLFPLVRQVFVLKPRGRLAQRLARATHPVQFFRRPVATIRRFGPFWRAQLVDIAPTGRLNGTRGPGGELRGALRREASGAVLAIGVIALRFAARDDHAQLPGRALAERAAEVAQARALEQPDSRD